jgi:hypothetical protein
MISARAHRLGRRAQRDQLLGRRRLEEAIEAGGHAIALRWGLLDHLHLWKELFECVAHPLDGSAASTCGLGHFIQGQTFGRPRQHPGEMK